LLISFLLPHLSAGAKIKFSQIAQSAKITGLNWVMNTLSLKRKGLAGIYGAVYSERIKNYLDSVAKVIRKEHMGGLVFFSAGPVRQV
jgi:hypothetical protein